ncbi:hypothetical protein ZHAS_00009089 [Anopheles sinensis]|uniref:Uncharacterized protein n=1 Tax=Anopheles sinensis TaxID=74873 RepID=A0A084VU50_ANOSI|nr:hypothetical protein ZHAS_00009089 [Anopheles sinensis]
MAAGGKLMLRNEPWAKDIPSSLNADLMLSERPLPPEGNVFSSADLPVLCKTNQGCNLSLSFYPQPRRHAGSHRLLRTFQPGRSGRAITACLLRRWNRIQHTETSNTPPTNASPCSNSLEFAISSKRYHVTPQELLLHGPRPQHHWPGDKVSPNTRDGFTTDSVSQKSSSDKITPKSEAVTSSMIMDTAGKESYK